jgi:glutamyl-tRNA reductase
MNSSIQQFFIAGVNYRKTDAAIRGLFAVNQDQYASILATAAEQGLNEVFIVSTCNRTEIYGLANSADELIDLLCSVTTGEKNTFIDRCYIKQGLQAIDHLFSVAAGLDSQILGDYEIVGQMKIAVKFAKERQMIGAFTERLFNTVLQSSKAVKTNTELSGGTVSVSFAAIQFLKDHLTDFQNKKIVLLGIGKIGRNTCKNLVDYLGATDITLINRSEEKAIELAKELGLRSVGMELLNEEITAADVIIVATNSDQPVITKNLLPQTKDQILIDLSIPNNIDPACKKIPGITLVNVDDLSKINDITLQKRMAEVPKARAIIKEHIGEFCEWHCMRKHASVLKSFKQTLQDLHEFCFDEIEADKEMIQKGVNNLALKMRRLHTPGCNYIQAINEYIEQPVFA